MADCAQIKRKLRRLKRLEAIIRFQGMEGPRPDLVWDRFFDLRDAPEGRAKYALGALCAMDNVTYKRVIEEYFALVYWALYRERGIVAVQAYDPEALAQLGLPFDAGEADVKRRFRELAKKHHPDTDGDAAQFIELMKAYERLNGRG